MTLRGIRAPSSERSRNGFSLPTPCTCEGVRGEGRVCEGVRGVCVLNNVKLGLK